MTTLYLIRHAEAEGNLYRRIHGHYDALVTGNGFAQIAALEERFRDIPVDAVYASDLHRTMTTARAVCGPKGLPLRTDPGLREIDLGDWEDRPWGEVGHLQPREMARFNHSDPTWQAPGGESLGQAGERMERTIRAIAGRHPGQTVALVSHGTAIRQFLARVEKVPPEQWGSQPHSENTAVTCLGFDGGEFQLLFRDDASHLPAELSTLGKQMWWKKGGHGRDVNLWFRPIDWQGEREVYLRARQEAWVTTHGPDIPFDGEGFLDSARLHLSRLPWGVTLALWKDEVVGVLELDPVRYAGDNAGYIPFCYVTPQRREQNLGVQLLGQAVSVYRPMGRDKLRLRCAPYNSRAQHFYRKYGFVKIGDETGSRVPLEILEKDIGYGR